MQLAKKLLLVAMIAAVATALIVVVLSLVRRGALPWVGEPPFKLEAGFTGFLWMNLMLWLNDGLAYLGRTGGFRPFGLVFEDAAGAMGETDAASAPLFKLRIVYPAGTLLLATFIGLGM